MAKRIARTAKSESVVPLDPADADWHPLGDEEGRDQSYVRGRTLNNAFVVIDHSAPLTPLCA